jgi:hypothetical protein
VWSWGGMGFASDFPPISLPVFPVQHKYPPLLVSLLSSLRDVDSTLSHLFHRVFFSAIYMSRG